MYQPMSLFRKLRDDKRGNVAITFGLTSVIAISAAGGALDYGRTFSTRMKMQSALDAAIVSGLATYREKSDWNLAVTKAQDVFKSQYAGAQVWSDANPTAAPDQPVLHVYQQNGQLMGTANGVVSTPFLNLAIGENTRVLTASSGVPSTSKKLEVAVMVDLTGSMGSTVNGTTKIAGLKSASVDLLNILLPTNGVNDSTVKVGIVPFADYVNAGTYAPTVTGLDATGGSYTNINNLASTKNGTFTGTYSGWTSNASGSQAGATSTNSALLPTGTTSTAGGTFSNSYCATPTTTTTNTTSVATTMYNNTPTGDIVPYYYNPNSSQSSSNFKWRGAAPNGLVKATTSSPVYHIYRYNNGWTYYSSTYTDDYYYAPLVTSSTGLTVQTRTANDSQYGNKTGNIGNPISVNNGTPPAPALKASTSPGGGYWAVYGIQTDGSLTYYWSTSGYYIPLYTALSKTTTTTTTVVGCENTATTTSSKLVTCVTERVNTSGATINTSGSTVTSMNYTDDAPTSGAYVGSYNHGNTSKPNYSSDGKCWVAGRELPAVIPLTNNRSTLNAFFTNATVGGATPGQLGTAWSMYMLSPKWSSVWPSSSTPAAFSDTGVIKAAILMTDGEYNLQFSTAGTSSNTSAAQALQLCKQMRDKGIKVYTIGFGFASNAQPPTANIEGMTDTERVTPAGITVQDRALDTLAKCASSNSSYFFPYDGDALRTAFQSISNGLIAAATSTTGRLTN